MVFGSKIKWYYFPISSALFALTRPYIKKISGRENIPMDKPFIIAANHASYIDDFVITTIITKDIKKKINIFVNSSYSKGKSFSNFLHGLGGIAVDVAKNSKKGGIDVDKKRKRRNQKAFDEAINCLKEGQPFAIFPEGGRSNDGKIKKAKVGVAKVVLASKTPVIPLGIKGSFDIMPKGTIFPRFRRMDIFIGKPMTFEKYYGKEKDYKTLRKVTTIIMKNIAGLIGQKYKY